MNEDEEDDRICRFCFDGAAEGELVAPCSCAGGQKWVHLACLHKWQSGILKSMPTHPDLIAENRQRVCNICSTAFTVCPPSHYELLQMHTGQELSELISEGSFIVSHCGFSRVLERQMATMPPFLRDGVGHMHWMRGVFFITKVCSSGIRTVRLRVDDQQDLEVLSRRMEAGWMCELQGRHLRIAQEGPLANTQLPADADAPSIRRELMGISTPAVLMLRSVEQQDVSEDSITAVNLTREIKTRARRRTYNMAVFEPALQSFLRTEGVQELRARIRHFIGGPCDTDNVACCIVCGGGEPYTLCQDLDSGLRTSHARGSRVQETAAVLGSESGAESSPQCADHQASHARTVQLLVFWGSAGWSRRQLLGEIAKSSWGLCKSRPGDIEALQPCRSWRDVYPRLRFAPISELSDSYAQDALDLSEASAGPSEAEAQDTQDSAAPSEDELQFLTLRRLLMGRGFGVRSRLGVLARLGLVSATPEDNDEQSSPLEVQTAQEAGDHEMS